MWFRDQAHRQIQEANIASQSCSGNYSVQIVYQTALYLSWQPQDGPFIYNFGESLETSFHLNTETMNSATAVKSQRKPFRSQNQKNVLVTQRFSKAEEQLEG